MIIKRVKFKTPIGFVKEAFFIKLGPKRYMPIMINIGELEEIDIDNIIEEKEINFDINGNIKK